MQENSHLQATKEETMTRDDEKLDQALAGVDYEADQPTQKPEPQAENVAGFDLDYANEYGRKLFGGAPDTIGQAYVRQAMRHQHDRTAAQYAARISELQKELAWNRNVRDKLASENTELEQQLTIEKLDNARLFSYATVLESKLKTARDALKSIKWITRYEDGNDNTCTASDIKVEAALKAIDEEK